MEKEIHITMSEKFNETLTTIFLDLSAPGKIEKTDKEMNDMGDGKMLDVQLFPQQNQKQSARRATPVYRVPPAHRLQQNQNREKYCFFLRVYQHDTAHLPSKCPSPDSQRGARAPWA